MMAKLISSTCNLHDRVLLRSYIILPFAYVRYHLHMSIIKYCHSHMSTITYYHILPFAYVCYHILPFAYDYYHILPVAY